MKHLLSILPSRCVSSATGYEVKTKGPGDRPESDAICQAKPGRLLSRVDELTAIPYTN